MTSRDGFAPLTNDELLTAVSRHRVLLTPAATFARYVVPRSGRIFVVDAVTALCVNAGDVVRLLDAWPAGNRAAVIAVDPELYTWDPLTGAPSRGRARIPAGALVLSSTALLLAQRLRRNQPSEAPRTVPAVRLSGATDRSRLVMVFVRALFSGTEDRSATVAGRRRNPVRWRVLADAVKQEIGAGPAAPHRIKDLAAQLDVSPFHLARIFRAETGLSIHQYLLRLRMAAALARLGDDSISISRLALDLGFSSHSHFTVAFQRLFGASPASVRSALYAEDHARVESGRGQLRHG